MIRITLVVLTLVCSCDHAVSPFVAPDRSPGRNGPVVVNGKDARPPVVNSDARNPADTDGSQVADRSMTDIAGGLTQDVFRIIQDASVAPASDTLSTTVQDATILSSNDSAPVISQDAALPVSQDTGTSPVIDSLVNPSRDACLSSDAAIASKGCTRTAGYWQTHSAYGPAQTDKTWSLIGENTVFFLSGQTYYQVLTASPLGNAYYILAHQYIGAKLNGLAKADFSAAQAAFDEATILFLTYEPSVIAPLPLSSPLRAKFISLAASLNDYNSGTTGPGHCV